MTTLQIYESIKQIFPSLLEPQIIAEMNNAQNKFARRTQVLRKVGLLEGITSQVSWDIPTEVVEVYEIELYDSDGKPLEKIDEDIDWVIDGGRLIIYDTSSDTQITTVPTSITYIWVRYSHLPTALVTVATALTLDVQFTEAVLAGALETLYGRTPVPIGIADGQPIVAVNFQAVKYWANKYRELVLDAKRWINSLDSTEGRVISYDHAGIYSLPKEAKDAYVSTTTWSDDQA